MFLNAPVAVWRQALRAGVRAFIAFVLTSALFVAPYLTYDNFGHSHPKNTPAHAHSMVSVLGQINNARVETALPVTVIWFVLRVHTNSVRPLTPALTAHTIRGPPAA